MWRYLVGALAGVLLVAGGVLVWQSTATATDRHAILPLRLAAGTATTGDEGVPEPPQATEKTREQKRFSRYDHDKNGTVSREEFLAARRKAFAKLDANHDGLLGFDEYAAKTEARFAAADPDRSGTLSPAEFAATRVQRAAKPSSRCPPAQAEARRNDDD